jgi:NADH:ubiquinone oxidoreductase subunit 6 (subunit J)
MTEQRISRNILDIERRISDEICIMKSVVHSCMHLFIHACITNEELILTRAPWVRVLSVMYVGCVKGVIFADFLCNF